MDVGASLSIHNFHYRYFEYVIFFDVLNKIQYLAAVYDNAKVS
jgi:hypothetical protein